MSLDQGGDGERVVHARLGIADPNFEGVEKGCSRMSHQIFLALSMQPVFTEFAVILVFGEGFERIRNAGARKTLKHF